MISGSKNLWHYFTEEEEQEGYNNSIYYTHSSFVRTMQEIFGVAPWLGDAANATDLSDLFVQMTLHSTGINSNGAFCMNITGVLPGTTNFVEASTNLTAWGIISTNSSSSNSFFFKDHTATNHHRQFYRVRQAP